MSSTGARLGVSLPPLVDGSIQGDIYLSIDGIFWYPTNSMKKSNHLNNDDKKKGISCVRTLWWGQDESESILFKPSMISNEKTMQSFSKKKKKIFFL